MWFRIFGVKEAAPEPAALLEHLHANGVAVEGHFAGDDLGWFRADFVLPGQQPLRLDRFLAEEDEVRDQLNAWAAWLENAADAKRSVQLMQLMIAANQVMTLECPRDRAEEPEVLKFCLALCRYLAAQTAGAFQVDGEGLFDANGELLVREDP